jgi:hypothetical protein
VQNLYEMGRHRALPHPEASRSEETCSKAYRDPACPQRTNVS